LKRNGSSFGVVAILAFIFLSGAGPSSQGVNKLLLAIKYRRRIEPLLGLATPIRGLGIRGQWHMPPHSQRPTWNKGDGAGPREAHKSNHGRKNGVYWHGFSSLSHTSTFQISVR
jgi:hypothetical protein